ncbi:Pycsar system effector family protein [Pedobacter sp. SAFR-022]|uniref:Pycsar system effector family protein n=1 Tax=Pedobacter sp. SAFR-022 TaxID=3436861 RepID=UPI003F7DF44C
MNYLEILDDVKTHVEHLFQSGSNEQLVYHNLQHTEHVIKHAVEIANFYKLSDRDFFIVQCACWFHDVGYLEGLEQHENKGAETAAKFLRSLNVDEGSIQEVQGCILATKMPQSPKTLLQQIVCDADLYHLGSEDFKERNKLMRKETIAVCNKEIDKNIWRLGTLQLLESHNYHTQYCIDKLTARKKENMRMLKTQLQESFQPVVPENTPTNTMEDKSAAKEKKKKDDKDSRPEKGIETMFRITSNNHQRLSDMADNKAHIMISINSIILSVVLSVLLRKLEDNEHLILPTVTLLLICLVTMVFSILATRPTVPPGRFTPEEVLEKKPNLLFFGNFYRMSLHDYNAAMEKMMDNRDYLYGSLIKDIYSQGIVLGRKYRLLRIAYNVFMFGIIVSVLGFILAVAFEV